VVDTANPIGDRPLVPRTLPPGYHERLGAVCASLRATIAAQLDGTDAAAIDATKAAARADLVSFLSWKNRLTVGPNQTVVKQVSYQAMRPAIDKLITFYGGPPQGKGPKALISPELAAEVLAAIDVAEEALPNEAE